MIRVCVCGGRDYDNREFLYYFMDNHLVPRLKGQEFVLIQGGAFGADRLAKEWAEDRGCHTETYEAKWHIYGKPAGMRRNREMLDSGIDVLVAFDGGTGTAGMVRICRDAGVLIIKPDRLRRLKVI